MPDNVTDSFKLLAGLLDLSAPWAMRIYMRPAEFELLKECCRGQGLPNNGGGVIIEVADLMPDGIVYDVVLSDDSRLLVRVDGTAIMVPARPPFPSMLDPIRF